MNRKNISTILACLLLASAFVISGFGRNPSDSPYYQDEPMPEPIILWAVVNTDPYWGYMHGYHDMLYAIKDELIKIGIDLRIQMYGVGTLWDIVWDERWNVPGDADGTPQTYTFGVDGWDITFSDWWQHPTGHLWVPSGTYAWATPDVGGYNIMHWNNSLADYFMHKAIATNSSVEHIQWMKEWQAQWMHDPPLIGVFYGEYLSAMASYVEGYDDLAWFLDITELTLNVTKFNEVLPDGHLRKGIGNDTLIYGMSGSPLAWNPLFRITVADELVPHMTHDFLYRLSREQMSPPSGNWISKPHIAAEYLTWHDVETLYPGEYNPDWVVARVPIRENITWSDGWPLNASDVAFTFNTILNPAVGASAIADLYMVHEVRIVDEYTVDFILPEIKYDFQTDLQNDWGLAIVPWHQLKDVDPKAIRLHPSNYDPIPDSFDGIIDGGPNRGLEVSGPYVVTSYTPYVEIKYEKRADYWGHEYGFGTELPDKFILKMIPDEAARLIALQNLEIDFGGYSTAPVETWEGMADWPTHTVLQAPHPGVHFLWMNLDNPILSNRYVRLAIAHAIPYDFIRNEIVPGWGFNKTLPGNTFVTPLHECFNTELGNYVYDIDVAKMYMNMWRYSQGGIDPNTGLPYMDPTLGPVGDADFSGWIDSFDFTMWADNIGTSSPWPRLPGQDIDPDHDNTGYANMYDFYRWRENVGNEYPYPDPW